MDPATIDYSKFTQNEELEGFRDELTAFIKTDLRHPPMVLIRITTKKELAELVKATDPARLFNFAFCPNLLAAGFAFLILVDHLKAMVTGKRPMESMTHFPQDYYAMEDMSYASSCALSLVRGDRIVIVAVGGLAVER